MREQVWFYQFPIGEVGIAEGEEGISAIFLKHTRDSVSLGNMEKSETKNIRRAAKELDEYFQGQRKSFAVTLHPEGTEFQRKIWDILCTIPYGETRSYEEIAMLAGNKKACRAVGMANNKNPILLMIPCHRVVGKNGNLTGYAGGLSVKEQLLKLEKRMI